MNEIILPVQRTLSADELELRVSGDGPAGRTLSWYPSVFNTLSEDLGGFRERIMPGAFRKTIKENDVVGLFNHDSNFVLGRTRANTLTLREDKKGLRAEAELPATSWANDLIVSIERGDITQGSFGFLPVKSRWIEDASEPIVERQEVRLFDASLVTQPAYPDADGASLRSLFSEFGLDAALLSRALASSKAGAPLCPDQIACVRSIHQELGRLITEPAPDHSDDDEPGIAHSLMQMRLQLLRSKPLSEGRSNGTTR